MPKYTEIYTLFTRADGQTQLIYSAEGWVKLRLLLETAGPVSVGTRADLQPTLGGKGTLLTTDVEREWVLGKGDRFYWISESINRVSFSTEAISYGLELIHAVNQVEGAVHSLKRVPGTGPQKPPEMPCPPIVPPYFKR